MGHLFRFEPKTLPPSLAGSIVGNTLVQGGSPAEWWRKQSNDFRTSFVRTMRTSMRNGEGVAQGIRRLVGGTIDGVTVPGIMKTTRAKAGALASTSMNAFTNNARVATYQQNNDVVKGTQQLSTLDNLTSDICVAYSEQAWDVETFEPIEPSSLPFNGGPPRHFNCRSTLVPILKSFQELGLTNKEAAGFPVGTRASMDGQVPGDTTFAKFLSGKSKTFQDKLLGPARAKLWRNGDITLTQLVDMRGNPMTVAQLEVKAGLKPKGTVIGQDPDAGFKAALRQQQAEEAAARKAKAAKEEAGSAKALKEAKEEAARARKRAEEQQKLRIAALRAERIAKEEAAKARKAARKAKKEAEEAAERAKRARIAKTKLEKEQREAAQRALREEAQTVTGPKRSRKAAEDFLKKEGLTPQEITLLAPEIDIIETFLGRFGPNEAKSLLKIAKQELPKRLRGIGELADVVKNLPKKIPVFKTSAAAEAWTRKHLINKVDNILEGKSRTVRKFVGRGVDRKVVEKVFDDLVAWAGYNKDLYRHIADVTVMMSRRFNMKLPNFIGLRRSHNQRRFTGKGGELASVHRQTDSLLLPANVTKAKRLGDNKLHGERWTQHFFDREDKLYKQMLATAEEAAREGVPHSKELVKALKSAIKEGNYQNTVGLRMGAEFDEATRAAASLWETIIHESGHRIHGRFAGEVDDILRKWQDEIRAGGLRRKTARAWSRQTSRYSTQNEREFVAEQFTRYMFGQHDRVYPPLLEYFDSIDTVKKFGINEISTLIKAPIKP